MTQKKTSKNESVEKKSGLNTHVKKCNNNLFAVPIHITCQNLNGQN